jgi:hypothetical protein
MDYKSIILILAIITILGYIVYNVLIRQEPYRNLISDEILKGNLARTGIYYDISND